MPANRSCITVIPEGNDTTINAIYAAMGIDPAFMPASATGSDPATHRYGHVYVDEAQTDVLLALAEGTLPESLDGMWGDTLPSEEDAIAATNGLIVSVAAGAVPTEHLAGILGGMQPPLQMIDGM